LKIRNDEPLTNIVRCRCGAFVIFGAMICKLTYLLAYLNDTAAAKSVRVVVAETAQYRRITCVELSHQCRSYRTDRQSTDGCAVDVAAEIK